MIAVLAMYGCEPWHGEPERVKRDVLILSRGSIDVLDGEIRLAI